MLQMPHSPDNPLSLLHKISLNNLKKLNLPEIDDFLGAMIGFAKREGVEAEIKKYLAADSKVVDLTAPENQGLSAAEVRKSLGLIGQGFEITGREGTLPNGQRIIHDGLKIIDASQVYPNMFNNWFRATLFQTALNYHPEFLNLLNQQTQLPFRAPAAVSNTIMSKARENYQALTIHDLELTAGKPDRERLQRTQLFTESMLVSRWRYDTRERATGRLQARSVLVFGENPDMTSPLMLALLTCNHMIANLPRDGCYGDVEQQAQLAHHTFLLQEQLMKLFSRSEEEKQKLLGWHRNNLGGVIESNPTKALERAEYLYASGIRTFRIYSPEPNDQLLETVKQLRALELEKGWNQLEIYAGQVTDVEQARELEAAGADAIYIGIGGGGRCSTGQVANLAIDWAQLLFDLRGQISIPVIVQGGANDKPTISTVLGAAGIGVVGKVGGTLESPGGYLFFFDPASGKIFKLYGGEASNRMRGMSDRTDALGRACNTEGETTIKQLRYSKSDGIYPSSLQALAELLETLATGMAFQVAPTIYDLYGRTDNLRQISIFESLLSKTH